MDKSIPSYKQLFEELEGKIQLVTREQICTLPDHTDIHSLSNPDEIKDYVDGVIRIIINLKEMKGDVNKDGLGKVFKDECNK